MVRADVRAEGLHQRVDKGDVVVVRAFGSGKSTLIKCVNRAGAVPERRDLLDGIKVTIRKPTAEVRARSDGVQHFELFRICGLSRNLCLAQEKVLAASMMKHGQAASCWTVSASKFTRKNIRPTVRRQQQRVAIARAADGPGSRCCSEPTSALDPEMISEVP